MRPIQAVCPRNVLSSFTPCGNFGLGLVGISLSDSIRNQSPRNSPPFPAAAFGILYGTIQLSSRSVRMLAPSVDVDSEEHWVQDTVVAEAPMSLLNILSDTRKQFQKDEPPTRGSACDRCWSPITRGQSPRIYRFPASRQRGTAERFSSAYAT